MYIEVNKAGLTYRKHGKDFIALSDTSISIAKGEFICLLGPSGCGKTTLLNLIAGFLKPTSGEVLIDGKRVEGTDPKRITVFQNYGLLPWRTVEGNILLGLENSKLTKAEKMERVDSLIALTGLSGLRQSHPRELSGGQQQRVAIARALAVSPDVLFMDEPFSALDPITRMKLQNDISSIASSSGITVIFVTHDIDEAAFLGDRIAVMEGNPGRIREIIDNRIRGTCDRTSAYYISLRERIFEILKLGGERDPEYVI